MVEQKEGTILFTGATASLRGSVGFVPLAVPKFALRGLVQSIAREFQPQVNTVSLHTQLPPLLNTKLLLTCNTA